MELSISRPRSRVVRCALALLGLGLVGVGAGAAGCGGDSTSASTSTQTPTDCVALADGSCVTETFANPPVLRQDGQGVYQLEIGPVEFSLAGKRQCGRGFNGHYPAPTLDIPASGGAARRVRVDVKSRFTKMDMKALEDDGCACVDANTGASCMPDHEDPASTCACANDAGEKCMLVDFNETNLHAHGVHTRPDFSVGGDCVAKDGKRCRTCVDDPDQGEANCYYNDDVLTHLEPGEGAQYRFDIDEDGTHQAGLNWYHPHIHGATAIQVAGGAAGALIVRGHLDEIAGIAKAKERVLVLTTPPGDATPLADGQACDEDHITVDDFKMLEATQGTESNLINGLRRPRMLMPPGQIERWRVVDASPLDEDTIALFYGKDSDCADLDLTRPPVPLVQIGRDGISLPKADADWPFAPPYMFVSPGYRVDALLDGSKLADGDTLCLMSARYLQEKTTADTPATPTPDDILKSITNGDVVAIINVSKNAGTPTETQMPDLAEVAAEAPPLTLADGSVDGLSRCAAVKQITDPEQIDQLAAMWLLFYNTDKLDACGFPDHNINGKNLMYADRSTYPYDRVLHMDRVDHWRLVSGFDGHPFHIHTNAYLVCPLPPAGSSDPSVAGRLFEPPFAHWRDTYLVNLARSVDLLAEYRFPGTYVLHCHKLTHEDHGMMEIIHACDPKQEDCDTLCSGGPCAWDHCAAGDDDCQKNLTATLCLLDPTHCPDAALRCTPCDDATSCPPNAHCGATPGHDGQTRCVPGCSADDDCALTEQCNGNGECVAAPACAPPCGPPNTCRHGTCS